MSLSLRINVEPRIEIRQEAYDYSRVIGDIREHFNEAPAGPADVRNLKELLRTIPQRQDNRLVYVIGGGWAVEVLTGKKRDHNNINVLVVDPKRTTLESNRCLDYLGVEYLDNALSRALVKKDIVKGNWKRGKCKVYVPSREFMIGTKLLPKSSVEFNREKDIEDVVNLLVRKPDVSKLTRVFGALPYIKNPESVASVVYGISDSGLRSKAGDVLRCLNSALREQLVAYGDRRNLPKAEMILKIGLSKNDNLTLQNYHQREAPDQDFFDWLRENRDVLVSEMMEVFHPVHPDKVPEYVDLKDLDENPAIVDDKEAYDVIYDDHVSGLYAVLSVKEKDSSMLRIWNPKGKLIYEKWSNENE